MELKVDSLKIPKESVINFDSPYRECIGRSVYDKTSVILGRGAYGIVIRASYKKRNVAVKILEKSNYFKYESLHQEANILNLDHKNIIRILKIVDCKTYGAIIMERFDGKSLQHTLDRYEIDLFHRLHILQDILAALVYLHQNKIVHTDVKPQNVLVALDTQFTNGYMCKLFDFGCSLMLNSSYEHFGGTVRYCAPEVLLGGRPDYSADIFSMAIIMWQVKENKIPYGTTLANETIIYKVVKEHMRPDSLKFRSSVDEPVSLTKEATKSETSLLKVKKFVDMFLTPTSYNRRQKNSENNSRKPPVGIGKSLHGSQQKNCISTKKQIYIGRKLFDSKLPSKLKIQEDYEDDSDDDMRELFIDSQLSLRSPKSILLVENEYDKLYTNCWNHIASRRFVATEAANIIEKFLCLLKVS